MPAPILHGLQRQAPTHRAPQGASASQLQYFITIYFLLKSLLCMYYLCVIKWSHLSA